ncbi:hypothetical protein [Oceanobacillus sp. CF4.6]|uniref:hypothetical protein n=1 Tax=Oceanobacillus sp. CF4.6 TaxID=3373080 RepID=UPI003EE6AC8C
MSELGLEYEVIVARLKEKGITDNNVIEAVSHVIVENNREIEKKLLKTVNEQLAVESKMKFF